METSEQGLSTSCFAQRSDRFPKPSEIRGVSGASSGNHRYPSVISLILQLPQIPMQSLHGESSAMFLQSSGIDGSAAAASSGVAGVAGAVPGWSLLRPRPAAPGAPGGHRATGRGPLRVLQYLGQRKWTNSAVSLFLPSQKSGSPKTLAAFPQKDQVTFS